MNLSITTVVEADGRHVLHLSGSLDVASRHALLEAGTLALGSAGASALVVNTADVSFCDSSGIGALVELAGDADDAGLGFALQNPSPRVARILEISGLLDAWPVEQVPVEEV